MNFDASTLMNGDCASRASRRAISVLPTPVGPIIRMFFGVTSSAISGGSRCRRMRLRSAIATARLALAWPMTYLSSSATISRGRQRAMRRLPCVREERSPWPSSTYSSSIVRFGFV